MGTSVVRELTAEERARMPEARQEMERAGAAACATKFTFLAAFDGTNNDENNLSLSGTRLSTNVSQLGSQGKTTSQANPALQARYYPGVGTGGDQGGLVNAAVLPTPAIQAAAEKAYKDFRRAALDYLRQNPDATPADIGAATTGFSRGGAAAIRFAQLVHERGLTDSDGQVIAPSGSVPITGMALIDPVARFVDAPMHIPPNVRGPVLSVIADHETRTDFRPLYHVDDPRVSLVHHPGNHVGNGGGYDPHGTAASVLEGVTGYLQQRGIAIADVPPERRHDPNAPQLLYTEVWQTARNGDVLENEDGSKNAVWRHDPPAAGRIGVKPQVPPATKPGWRKPARNWARACRPPASAPRCASASSPAASARQPATTRRAPRRRASCWARTSSVWVCCTRPGCCRRCGWMRCCRINHPPPRQCPRQKEPSPRSPSQWTPPP